jgi:hypothetical protein
MDSQLGPNSNVGKIYIHACLFLLVNCTTGVASSTSVLRIPAAHGCLYNKVPAEVASLLGITGY